MSINFNHVTNDITASSGSVSINGSVPSGGGASAITISNKTAAYTIVAGDLGKIINCTSGTFTVSLTAAATLGSGFNCWIWNTSATSTDAITIDPNGAETIDGVTTIILRRGEGTQVVCDGTNWQTGDKKTMRGYAENITDSQARPVASGNLSIAMGGYVNASTASGIGSIAIHGNATASQGTAIGLSSGGSFATAAVNAGSVALGGSYASGLDSFAAAIGNNSSGYGANGTNSVAIGSLNKVTSSSGYGTSIGGYSNTSSANWAVTLGGRSCTAGFDYSIALGYSGTPNAVGKIAFGHVSGVSSGVGWGTISLYGATTNATPVVLVSNTVAASTNNQVILPNNSAYAFTGTVVARQQASGGTQSAAWKVEGLIRREANAASTTLVASTVTAISNVPGWTLALSADTTNGGLAVTATGAAATNIRWVATIDSSEVTYA